MTATPPKPDRPVITTRHDPEGRARLDALARKGAAIARAKAQEGASHAK